MASAPVTLVIPGELAERIENLRSRCGAEDILDVIDQAVHALEDDGNPEFTRFMDEEVLPAYEQYLRHPHTGKSSEQIAVAVDFALREMFAEERTELPKAG